MIKLIIGGDGQVGQSLQHVYAYDRQAIFIGRKELDLNNHDAIWYTIEKYKPNVIINSAAYTNVDQAEKEREIAYRINSGAVKIMAEYASERRCLLVHYSSDYVFNGRKQVAYIETDPTNPLSVYGMTKCESEKIVKNSNCPFLIFRTSGVFSLKSENFPNKILRAASMKRRLNVVTDQIGSPTSADLIASITEVCISRYFENQNNSFDGVYHLTSAGKVSWYEFAKYIICGARKRGMRLICTENQICPITSSDYRSDANRPKNSVLNCDKIKNNFQVNLPSWKEDIDKFLDARVL